MNYFSHDSNARNDERIIRLRMKHGAAGYGVFFMLLELLRNAKGYMCATDYKAISYELSVDAALVRAVVEDFNLFLFTNDHSFFFSSSLLQNMKRKDEVSRARSAAGKRGGRPRKQFPTASPISSPAGAIAHSASSPPAGANAHYASPNINSFLGQSDQECICMKFHISKSELSERYAQFVLDCKCRKTEHADNRDTINHFNDWLRIVLEAEKTKAYEQSERANKANKRRGIQTTTPQTKDYNEAF